MMYCNDGLQAAFPPPATATKPERGAPWRAPDAASSACQRCGRPCWQHRSFPPVIADEIDRAIYAAAFVAAMRAPHSTPENGARAAMLAAEELVELHRRARSGT
jgi:hypothetical protein